ncbi:MAG: YkgJ family cysteine cluster protein [Verrucomicrobiales bacterium]|nr:YkgJ family cysteine cluster protein [Verrucomicrobiales bacterium]
MKDPSPPRRYVCQRCGNCCRWPGDVRVTDEEIEKIAHHLGLPLDLFIERYTRLNANRTGLSLIDQDGGACVFLKGKNECLIQAVKPSQCAGFPNAWNFPGWREMCEALEVSEEDGSESRS